MAAGSVTVYTGRRRCAAHGATPRRMNAPLSWQRYKAEVPAWVREMDDDAAYMALITSNAQSELSPLERGLHALHATEKGKHGRSVAAYAKEVGSAEQTVRDQVAAAEVFEQIPERSGISPDVSHIALTAIHSAPRWLWPALVEKLEAENLHRAELLPQERADQIAEWISLTMREQQRDSLQSAQNEPIESKRSDGRGHRPEGGLRAAVRELRIDRNEARRSTRNNRLCWKPPGNLMRRPR